MQFKKIIPAIVYTGTALSISLGSLSLPSLEGPLIISGLKPAFAQQKGESKLKYNEKTDPLKAGPGIKALAKKAKRGDSLGDLGNAKRLFELLQAGKPGGIKVADSGDVPTTAEETLKNGGDCSGIANAVMAALNEMKIESGIIILDLGKGLLHVLAYAEIDGKRYLMDPQLDSFGKGGAQLPSGKMLVFTYEEAKRGIKKSASFVRETPFEKARGSYHFEWGSYFEGKGEYMEAIAAFRNALKLDSGDVIAQRKLKAVSSGLFNQLMAKADKAIKAKEWNKAAELNEKALEFIPEHLGEKGKAQLRENIAYCREKMAEESK